MSATPLNISITPDLSVIRWFGRNQDPTVFTITNNDDRAINTCELYCVRGDFLPKGSGRGDEKTFAKKGIGEDLITQGWLEARLVGDPSWTALTDTTPLIIGVLAKDESANFEIRLVVPDEVTNEGKTNFALMVAASEAVPPPVPTLLYSNDFESYAIDAYPSDVFTIKYNGSGTANQKIISVTGHEGSATQVFRLQGRSSWASESLIYFTPYEPLDNIFIVDAYVSPITGVWAGSLRMRNNAGTWGTAIAEVKFSGGNIQGLYYTGATAGWQILGTYTVSNWYRVTMQHNISAKTYNIYIDDVLLAENLAMHPTLAFTHLDLVAGNSTTYTEMYFDDLAFYAGEGSIF